MYQRTIRSLAGYWPGVKSFQGRLGLLLALLLLSAAVAGILLHDPAAADLQVHPRPPEEPMSPIYPVDGGPSVGRTVLRCPAGDCVLLHPPPRPLAYSLDSLAGQVWIEVHGAVVPRARDEWIAAERRFPNTFNCFAYSVGPFVGLTPEDWLNGKPEPYTNGESPLGVILASYFEAVAQFDEPRLPLLASVPELREHDVVCFFASPSDDGDPAYVHAGRVIVVDGENWQLSKFGDGPIFKTPMEAVWRVYPATRSATVYRVRPRTPLPNELTAGRPRG